MSIVHDSEGPVMVRLISKYAWRNMTVEERYAHLHEDSKGQCDGCVLVGRCKGTETENPHDCIFAKHGDALCV